MSSATLLRAYRLAVQRQARVWSAVPSWTGVNPAPDYLLAFWAQQRATHRRYERLCRRLEARLLARLGVPGE